MKLAKKKIKETGSSVYSFKKQAKSLEKKKKFTNKKFDNEKAFAKAKMMKELKSDLRLLNNKKSTHKRTVAFAEKRRKLYRKNAAKRKNQIIGTFIINYDNIDQFKITAFIY